MGPARSHYAPARPTARYTPAAAHASADHRARLDVTVPGDSCSPRPAAAPVAGSSADPGSASCALAASATARHAGTAPRDRDPSAAAAGARADAAANVAATASRGSSAWARPRYIADTSAGPLAVACDVADFHPVNAPFPQERTMDFADALDATRRCAAAIAAARDSAPLSADRADALAVARACAESVLAAIAEPHPAAEPDTVTLSVG